MKSDEAKRLKELEIENSRLKRLLADAELDKAMLKVGERSVKYILPGPLDSSVSFPRIPESSNGKTRSFQQGCVLAANAK